MNLILIMAILTAPNVLAQDIDIIKEVQEQAIANEIINIKITIFNNAETSKSLKITERIPGNFELINPKESTYTEYHNGIQAYFLEWDLNLPPHQSDSIIYNLKPLQAGDLTLSPTKVININTQTIYQGEITTLTIKCNANNLCELGENYLNCPQDCPTGSNDGICDHAVDSICDPDCTDDPDCTFKDKVNFTTLITFILIIAIIIILIKLFKKRNNFNSI